MKTANHRLIGNLISARSFIGKVTEKAGPMAALGPAFRPVLALVTGDEVHPQSSVARITQDQPECCQQMTPPAVFCAERSPGHTTTVFRSWLGTCPFQYRSVHSARCPNDAPPSIPRAVSSGRWRSGCRRAPEAAMSQDLLDQVGLRRFDKGNHGHLTATLRTRQRVDVVDSLDQVVDSLDQHRPTLTAAVY